MDELAQGVSVMPWAASSSTAWRMLRAGQRLAPPQRLHPLALDLGGGGDADEFLMAQRQGREIEAKGFDDPAVRAAAAVALALLVVADDEESRPRTGRG